MKKTVFLSLILVAIFTQAVSAQQSVKLITSDIDNFWKAYDQIILAKDSATKYESLNKLFIEKGTAGLKAMMEARAYTPKSYIDAIANRQPYLNSIRNNTLKVNDYASAIASNVEKLKQLYPDLKPAEIYFTMGAFRSGGTTLGNMVLIGSEIAMADENLGNLVFTNIHEYVHTQQKTTIGNNLITQCVLEGVAEFMAEQVMSTRSTLPALSYGKENTAKIKEAFAQQMFNYDNGFWLYSNEENQFKVRDLGYYVGYAIAESYYNKAKDKREAIKSMIELDYNNENALDQYVDQSGWFSKSVKSLRAAYESSRPVVISTSPLNGTAVDASATKLKITFSTAIDQRYRNFELGPLGTNSRMTLKKFLSFSPDGKSVEFEIELKPGQHYQLVVGDGFRSLNGVRLVPYLIDFETGRK